MPRAGTKKPRTKGPKTPMEELPPNGAPDDSRAVATAVAEPPSDELQPPTTPVEPPEAEKAQQQPVAEKDKDRIAATSLNIAKLQAMSMADRSEERRVGKECRSR